jgi:hypothetical protein
MAVETSEEKVAHMCSQRRIVHSHRKSFFVNILSRKKLRARLTAKVIPLPQF